MIMKLNVSNELKSRLMPCGGKRECDSQRHPFGSKKERTGGRDHTRYL